MFSKTLLFFGLATRLLLILLLVTFVAPSYAEREWVSLGRSSLGSGNIFVDKTSLKKMDEGVYAAISYEDLGVMQRGLDEFDSTGKSRFNTKIRYRSYRSVDLYDCKRKLIGNLETRYYTSEKPEKASLVHTIRDQNPVWSEHIIELKVFNYVCNRK